ncbi:MarR family winged helix-turn-helix transcriptional regulator [Cryptosporangium phraense]|uniref:MarR family transcriptional regulator n=1 Tax=Cryptosporangium phraense TaxID=2593070 RepID=A0A545AG09_9ACTN|nr:MarR family transcriptional regulator [Cryptosporangium phraense]TQS40274.1 MarR family transcriptional regulator [Cryptosporangium phraense]
MTDLLRLFTRAHKLLQAASDEAMSAHGVRVGQNLVLEVLWADDGLTPGDLATRLRVSTPTVVNAATRMEAAGLITRRRDDADARLVRLYLTDAGRNAEEPVRAARKALAEKVTAEFTAEERAATESALIKIIGALERP